MGGDAIWWIIGGLLVLALLWFLFSRMAKSDSGAESGAGDSRGAEDSRGPSGAAWEQKFPEAGGGGAEGDVPPRT
jgi:hypothetical protein